MAMPPKWTQWADELLLPLMYWHEQLHRTRCPGQKAQIALVLQAVEEAFTRHPCTLKLTAEVLAGWKAWAGEHARAFQRASSAVAGRNGYLSQMQHNHRGLPLRRYQVWTVLHNFDCRAADGTTPASRFFRRSFPDLFERVLSRIDALPMPRQRRQASRQVLEEAGCPALNGCPQFRSPPTRAPAGYAGRVEHLASYQVARFHSLDELLAFMIRVLADVERQAEAP